MPANMNGDNIIANAALMKEQQRLKNGRNSGMFSQWGGGTLLAPLLPVKRTWEAEQLGSIVATETGDIYWVENIECSPFSAL